MIDWISLRSEEELKDVIAASHDSPIVVFKHSTRCPISAMVKTNFEREWDSLAATPKAYLIHVIEDRPVSNKIAQELIVDHQSPQLLLLKDGLCEHHTSHADISVAFVEQHLN